MRALLLADEMFARCERSMIHRLAVGLADEGFEVRVAVPEEMALSGSFDLIHNALGYRPSALGLVRKLVAGRVLDELRSEEPDAKLGVVHCFGGSSWDLGLEIANQSEASVVLEMWRLGLVPKVRNLRSPKLGKLVLAVPDGVTEREVLKEAHGLAVRSASWGGWVSPERTKVFREGREHGLVMIGNGGDIVNCRAAFDGIAEVLQTQSDVMLFVDAKATQRAGLWKRARLANVQDRISIIDNLEDRRDLILRCDMLLSPEARGEHRTILLDAMGAAIPVVARADQATEAFAADGATVKIEGDSSRLWTQAVMDLLANPDKARLLGENARRHISENLRWSHYLASVGDIYEWLGRNESAAATKAES